MARRAASGNLRAGHPTTLAPAGWISAAQTSIPPHVDAGPTSAHGSENRYWLRSDGRPRYAANVLRKPARSRLSARATVWLGAWWKFHRVAMNEEGIYVYAFL